MKYSASSNGFYDPDININIPTDAVEIDHDTWYACISIPATKCIVADENGYPTIVDRPGPTIEQRTIQKTNLRDTLLNNTDWLVMRHMDETLANVATTLASQDYGALLAYRQSLRDITKDVSWPDTTFPVPPSFVG